MTAYKKTMREALEEVSSYKLEEEVELEEAMSKDMALKILSMAKNQDFKIASGDRAPMIYLSNDDRDELKKEFGRLGRDVPGPNKGATVMQIVNLAYSGNDRKPFDTEGGKHMISWDKGGKKIGTPKKVSDAAKLAGLKLEEVELDEDGHADVASAIRQCKTVMEDAQQIMAKLQTMSPEDSLPTWWTNKFAVASNSMNKMRDYIVNPLGEALDKEDEPTVKKVVKMLKKASGAHAGQAKDLEKAIDEDSVEIRKEKN